MSELQLPIDPRLRLSCQFLSRQLTSRQHDLAVFVIDCIAVNIYIIEIVIKANGLYLVISILQRTRVPQADIINGYLILLQVGRGWHVIGGE